MTKIIGARLHTIGRGVIDQQDICSECFSWLEGEDRFCWGCGVDIAGTAYSREDLEKNQRNKRGKSFPSKVGTS